MRKYVYSIVLLLASAMPLFAQQVAEKLGREPVAVKASNGVLVSWRSLKSDPEGLTFNVYRNGTKIASNISTKTNYLDSSGKAGNVYKIEASNGETSETTAWTNIYKTIEIDRPAGGTIAKWRPYNSSTKKYEETTTMDYYYMPNDMSIADLDGDGEYEIVMKWEPNSAQDNSLQCGYTANTIIDAYKLDGTRLWRIDLGKNIRAGAHYSPFIVYDFDGDGKAEMICKTSAGSLDGQNKYVTDAATYVNISEATDNEKDYRKETEGTILSGPEYLTVFNGETGAAMHTIYYRPDRALNLKGGSEAYSSSWGDSYGNRGERYNAAVAYLDGLDKLPTAIMQRGYYTQAFLWAVDWDGKELSTRWIHYGNNSSSWKVYDDGGNVINSGTGKSSYGQGVHGISVGDVNEDGYDEIVIGSATIAHDGALLCSTGKGHGDAIHLSDLVPSRPGLEVMMPHEESPYGYDVHDATTGYLLASATGTADNGRGLAGDFVPGNGCSEFWSSIDNNLYSCEDGSVAFGSKPDTNFRIYWSGSAYDQTFDGRYSSSTTACSPRIRYYNAGKISDLISFSSYGSPQTCNYTKATPCLQADFLGDWREELIMWSQESTTSDKCKLLIYSTPLSTAYKVPCLMEDHVYRMGIAWQNSSYNQPPHLSYSLPIYLGLETLPDPDAEKPLTEVVTKPSSDKATITGLCYTAGANGEFTASYNGDYVKTRTGNNDAIVFTVNDGYEITAMKVEGWSNNSSTKADRSIYMTGVYVDDSSNSLISTKVIFPGGTAGQTPVSKTIEDFTATKSIKLTFDNSNIVTSTEDSAGKNKQVFLKVTFTYKETATGIVSVKTFDVIDGSLPCYNLNGQRISNPKAGEVYVKNGKKFIAK